MDKLKEIVFQHQDKLKFGLMAGIGIGAFNCFARADYNLILYIYVYYIWNMLDSKVNLHINKETQENEKINSFFLLGYSLIIDLVWVFYWGSVWSALKLDNQVFIHSLVKLFSWLAILLKVNTIINLDSDFVKYWDIELG